MNRETLDAFLLWGDRANRDTSHLMDIVVAGTIDQLVGHGTVILRPGRLEEIVSRIAPRVVDKDGGWVVTLLPGDSEGKTPETTSPEIARVAGRALGLTLDDLSDGTVSAADVLVMLRQLAGSALTQAG